MQIIAPELFIPEQQQQAVLYPKVGEKRKNCSKCLDEIKGVARKEAKKEGKVPKGRYWTHQKWEVERLKG